MGSVVQRVLAISLGLAQPRGDPSLDHLLLFPSSHNLFTSPNYQLPLCMSAFWFNHKLPNITIDITFKPHLGGGRPLGLCFPACAPAGCPSNFSLCDQQEALVGGRSWCGPW